MPLSNTGSRWVGGRLEFFEKANPDRVFFVFDAAGLTVEVLSGAKTLDNQDCGKVFMVDTTAVITLPATVVGLNYHVINIGLDGAVQISMSPAALDLILSPDSAGTDNKDLINTLATANRGDSVKLLANGTTGWLVTELHGTWAQEA